MYILSGPVFQALSYGMILLTASVSFKNHNIEASDWLLTIFTQSEDGANNCKKTSKKGYNDQPLGKTA